MTGTIVSVVGHRGFGFISPDVSLNGGEAQSDLFFHASNLAGGLVFGEQLIEMRVAFDSQYDAHRARSHAVNVRAA